MNVDTSKPIYVAELILCEGTISPNPPIKFFDNEPAMEEWTDEAFQYPEVHNVLCSRVWLH